VDGKPAKAMMDVNYAVIPVRPAGGAWSNVRDMLKYVQMELDEGALSGGERYMTKDTLLARRIPQVSIGQDMTYGMGLMVDTKYSIPVVHHGGDMIGYHSDMMWLPQHNVGAVILTNGDPGWVLRTVFRRKLLEVLFDGRPEADADVAAQAKSYFERLAADRKLMTVPAAAEDAGKLSSHYANDALGEITVAPHVDDLVERPDLGVPEGGQLGVLLAVLVALAESLLDLGQASRGDAIRPDLVDHARLLST